MSSRPIDPLDPRVDAQPGRRPWSGYNRPSGRFRSETWPVDPFGGPEPDRARSFEAADFFPSLHTSPPNTPGHPPEGASAEPDEALTATYQRNRYGLLASSALNVTRALQRYKDALGFQFGPLVLPPDYQPKERSEQNLQHPELAGRTDAVWLRSQALWKALEEFEALEASLGPLVAASSQCHGVSTGRPVQVAMADDPAPPKPICEVRPECKAEAEAIVRLRRYKTDAHEAGIVDLPACARDLGAAYKQGTILSTKSLTDSVVTRKVPD